MGPKTYFAAPKEAPVKRRTALCCIDLNRHHRNNVVSIVVHASAATNAGENTSVNGGLYNFIEKTFDMKIL